MNDSLGGKADTCIRSAQTAFAQQMRTTKAFPFNHISRTYQKRIIDIIQQMTPGETWDEASERMRKKFEALMTKAVGENVFERDQIAFAV